MMYNSILEALKAENKRHLQNRIEAINTNDIALKNNSTAAKWTLYNDQKITREQCAEIAKTRAIKEFEKSYNSKVAYLSDIEKAAPITSIVINVRYVKNAMWGYNPQVKITVFYDHGFDVFTSSASGCNYDKAAAAIAKSLNNCNSFIKLLCNEKEQLLKTGTILKKTHMNDDININNAGIGAIPYVESSGKSTIIAMIQKLGFNLVDEKFTDKTDFYMFEKAE